MLWLCCSSSSFLVYWKLVFFFFLIFSVFNFQVSGLFDDHPDLLDEFTRFLPDSAHNAPHPQNSLQRFNERSSAPPMLRQLHTEKVIFYVFFFP